MYLSALKDRNPQLLELGFRLHQEGVILPDTYLLDLDAIELNAIKLKKEADSKGLELLFMTKQLGRNPAVCKSLVNLGYKGAVVVDFREAQVMMDNNIPIAHAGHLVQIPDSFLPKLIEYGVGLITVYSLEKAKKINDICCKMGRVQDIALKFYSNDDYIYPSQESGFPIENLAEVVGAIKKLSNLNFTTLTAFPCFLYNQEQGNTLPVNNLYTLKQAAKEIQEMFDFKPKFNLPSCTQTTLIKDIVNEGGTSGEPGSALIGMTPNNRTGDAAECPSILYISEISHNFENHAFCYGGGTYHRGEIDCALVGRNLEESYPIKVLKQSPENIDYHFELQEKAEIGQTAAMCFRTQVFVTRSQVAVITGIHSGNPQLEGIYSSQGQKLSEGKSL